ncbi:MAG: S8 family serine peptidase, partial [Candidatus Altiarchaeota archaeon]|nr:S8 family serine peptidase [Candidatus Altiarchaeota archaeon]
MVVYITNMRLASVAVLFFLFLAFAHAQNESIDVNESIKLVLQNDSMAFDVFFLNGTLSNETLVSNSTFLNGTLVDLNETVLDETATDVLTSVNESVSEINATLSNETFVDNSTFSNETITDVEESIVGNSSFSNEAFDLNESVVGNFSFSNESAVVPPFNETVQYFNGTDLNETVVDIPSLNETSYIENITLPFVNVTLPELNGAVPGNSSDVVGQFMNLSVGFGEEFVFVVEQMNESMNESAGFSAGGNVSGGFSENISSVVGNISAGHAVNDTLRLLEAEAFTQALSEGKLTNNLFNNLTGMSDEDEIRVMVYLKDDEVVKALSRNEFSAKSAKKQDEIMAEKTKAIRSKQDKVLSKISDDKFKPKHKFNLINGFSGMVKREGITALLEDPDVEKIEEVATVKLHLAQSVPMINTTRAWNLQFGGINITGAGQAVCVIDSGVNYSHPSMGGCSRSDFTSGNCDKVPWGHDYYNELGQQDNDPLDEDDYHGGHGTNVAGIIASEHTTYRGVAPDAKIIAMK